MKFAYVLAMSAAMVLAPVAQAQITCEQAQKLITAATEDFDSLVGEQSGDSVYQTSYSLDGAQECQITLDFSSSYACMWTFDTLAAATTDYGLQSHALAECFGDWERAPFDAPSGDPKTKTLEGASYFAIDNDDTEYTWITFVEEYVDGDTHQWQVWVGLDYF